MWYLIWLWDSEWGSHIFQKVGPTDGSQVVSLTHRLSFAPRTISVWGQGYSGCKDYVKWTRRNTLLPSLGPKSRPWKQAAKQIYASVEMLPGRLFISIKNQQSTWWCPLVGIFTSCCNRHIQLESHYQRKLNATWNCIKGSTFFIMVLKDSCADTFMHFK
jgi:hypothetical protein